VPDIMFPSMPLSSVMACKYEYNFLYSELIRVYFVYKHALVNANPGVVASNIYYVGIALTCVVAFIMNI